MYQVGSFCFDIRNPHHVPVPDNLKRFETEQGTPEHLYRLTLVNHVEVKESEFMLNKDNMKVYVDEHVHDVDELVFFMPSFNDKEDDVNAQWGEADFYIEGNIRLFSRKINLFSSLLMSHC